MFVFIVYCVWYGMVCVCPCLCVPVCAVCVMTCVQENIICFCFFVFLFFCFFCFFVCLFLLILLDDAMKFSVFGDDGQAVKIDDNVKRWSVCFK